MALGSGGKDLVGRLALAKLSDDLFASEEARQAFTADPDAYIAREYGVAASENDSEFIHRLRDMVADGFCCQGCGCTGASLADRVTNPAIRQGLRS